MPCYKPINQCIVLILQVYAQSLRSSSSNVLRRSLVPYSTSDSDTSYHRDLPTPQADLSPDYALSASDTDTEIVKTDDGFAESSDRMTPNIDISDTDVVFVEPYTRQDSYDGHQGEPVLPANSEVGTIAIQIN